MKHTVKQTAILGAAAAVLLTSGAALAENTVKMQSNTNVKVRGDTATYIDRPAHVEEVTRKDIERGLKKTGDSIERAAASLTTTAEAATDGFSVQPADRITQNNSADNMIGKPVMNAAGDRVGNVHDIILAKDGAAKYLVVADGSAVSVGDKKALFDYSVINGRDANGGLLTSITEAQIDAAKAISYDRNEPNKADTQVIAADETSVRNVIGSKITGPEGKNLASVKDVAIDNGRAADLVVAYDQFLGLGGTRLALPYNQLAVTNDNSAKPDIRLNAQQVAVLNGYQNTSN